MKDTEYELGIREKEAYNVVCKLNEELYSRFGRLGDKGLDEVPHFYFSATEHACAVLWGEICIWDSENSPEYDDEDNLIPIEKVVREEVDKIATAAEWIARDHEREKVSLDHCLFFLNELVKTDAEALHKLIETRVPCNRAMADHPTIQVQAAGKDNQDVKDSTEEQWTVGLLGILNGLFGAYRDGGPKDGWGQVTAVFEAEGRGALSCFRRTADPHTEAARAVMGGLPTKEG